MSRTLRVPLFEGEYSRLVIDLNRSVQHRKAFSDLTRPLPSEKKSAIIEKIHAPFRRRVLSAIESAKSEKVTHISVHSFTPRLNGETRNCDIGLLYDPRRRAEAHFAREFRIRLERSFPAIRIRMNYPYRGSDDGHTTHLRKTFRGSRYIGLELELNQAWLQQMDWKVEKAARTASEALAEAIRML